MTTPPDSESRDLTADAPRPVPVAAPGAKPDAGDAAILDPDLRTLSFVASASLSRHLDAAAATIADTRYILAGAVHTLDAANSTDGAGANLRLRLEMMRQQMDAIAFTARQLAGELAD